MPVLVVPMVGAVAWLPLPGRSLTAGGPTTTAAVIQGNVPRVGQDCNAQRRAVLDNHVQTTDATFGYSDENEQQPAMSRLRAVATGGTVAIAATSGISAVVAPDGTVVRSSSLFTPAVFVEEIAQRNSVSVVLRLRAAPGWDLTALGAGAVLAALLLRLPGRSRR